MYGSGIGAFTPDFANDSLKIMEIIEGFGGKKSSDVKVVGESIVFNVKREDDENEFECWVRYYKNKTITFETRL